MRWLIISVGILLIGMGNYPESSAYQTTECVVRLDRNQKFNVYCADWPKGSFYEYIQRTDLPEGRREALISQYQSLQYPSLQAQIPETQQFQSPTYVSTPVFRTRPLQINLGRSRSSSFGRQATFTNLDTGTTHYVRPSGGGFLSTNLDSGTTHFARPAQQNTILTNLDTGTAHYVRPVHRGLISTNLDSGTTTLYRDWGSNTWSSTDLNE